MRMDMTEMTSGYKMDWEASITDWQRGLVYSRHFERAQEMVQ